MGNYEANENDRLSQGLTRWYFLGTLELRDALIVTQVQEKHEYRCTKEHIT